MPLNITLGNIYTSNMVFWYPDKNLTNTVKYNNLKIKKSTQPTDLGTVAKISTDFILTQSLYLILKQTMPHMLGCSSAFTTKLQEGGQNVPLKTALACTRQG